MEYSEEREICNYLGLEVISGQVYAYYGPGHSYDGKVPTGWQMVCHISKLKMYLMRKIHEEHYKKVSKV